MNAYLKINVKSIRILPKCLTFRYVTKKIYTIFVLEIFTYLNVHTYSDPNLNPPLFRMVTIEIRTNFNTTDFPFYLFLQTKETI